MVILVVTFVLSLFFNTATAFGDIPYFTVYRLEVYRLLLSPLVGNSLLMLVFAFMFFPAMGGRIEAGYGSSYFLYMLVIFTVIINVIFTTFCMIMELIGSAEMSFLNSSGFWTLIFALITMECVANPEAPRRIMFIPVDIPSLYYPLVLYVFFCLFSGIQYHYAFGMLVGYWFQTGKLDSIKPTSYYLESLESSGGWLHTISRNNGWVLAGAALGHDAWVPVSASADWNNSNNSASTGERSNHVGASSRPAQGAPAAEEKKELFPGSGHKLGSQSASLWAPKSADSTSMNREALANKRLAALGLNANGGAKASTNTSSNVQNV